MAHPVFGPFNVRTVVYYNHFFGQFDDVAERVLQLEGIPVSTVKGYLELATLKEDEGTHFEAKYVLEQVLADFTYLMKETKESNALAEKDGDVGTMDLLGGLISWLEKEIWILKASLS